MATLNLLGCLLLTLYAFGPTTADDYRLPTYAVPSHYEVHLNLTQDAFTSETSYFEGTSVVYFQVNTDVTEIQLHSSYEFISIVSITLNNVEIPEENYSVNSTTDILTISYPDGLLVDTLYGLKFTYNSHLSDGDMYGFYKSSYETSDGETRYLATTQFQATYARRVFPSWDEPAFKATFTILITYPAELNVLGNTPGTIQRNDT